MPSDESSLDVRFRHFKAINSDWDVDANLAKRKRSESVPDSSELECDERLRGALGSIATLERSGVRQAPLRHGKGGEGGKPLSGPDQMGKRSTPPFEAARPPVRPRASEVAAHGLRVKSGLLAAKGDLPAAIRHARGALEHSPGHASFGLHLAGLLLANGQSDEACAVEAAALAWREADPYYQIQMGLSAEARGDLETAIDRFRAAVALPADPPEAHGLLFRLLLSEGRETEAREVLGAWDIAASSDPVVLTVAAGMWGACDQGAEAISCLERAIAASPSAELLTLLSGQYLRLGQLDRAEQTLRAAIAHYTSDCDRDRDPMASLAMHFSLRPRTSEFEMHRLLGSILEAQGRLEEAEASLRDALGWNPLSPVDLLHLADILEARGRLDEAAAERSRAAAMARRLLGHPPNNMLGRHELECADVDQVSHYADCLMRAGARREAIDALQDLARRWPANFVAKWRSAAFQLLSGEFAAAAVGLREALALRPCHMPAITMLSIALRHDGQFDEAISFARRAVELAPNDPGPCHQLAMALAAAGQLEEAATVQRQVLDLVPNHEGAVKALHSDLHQLGRDRENAMAADEAVDLSGGASP
jgi:tetratricopeptide (TPR) repeat protein